MTLSMPEQVRAAVLAMPMAQTLKLSFRLVERLGAQSLSREGIDAYRCLVMLKRDEGRM